jgi:HEAT repeat protein
MGFINHQAPESAMTDERKNARQCADLIAALEDKNPTSRRWAARDLANCPEAAGPLAARLRMEKDVSVREVIFSTLVKLGDPASIEELVECLRSDDPSLRNEAVDAMRQLPEEVAPIMGGLLHDPDPDTRIFAVNILESLRHPDVEAWLIEVIAADPHVNVCATAVDLLSEVGTAAAAEPLEALKARFSDEPYIGFGADLALKRIREGC